MRWKRHMLLATLILAAILLLGCTSLLLFFLVTDSQRGVAKAENVALARRVRERLQLGMTRVEVEQAIDGDAKKLYRCNWRVDVYLIGSSDPGRAAIWYLKFRDGGNGNHVLEEISGLDQDQLPGFESCQVSYPSPGSS